MIILDTHIWLKWVIEEGRGLPPGIVAAVREESKVAVSAISSFEVAHLVKRGRVELPLPVHDWLHEALDPSGIESLPLTSEIAARSVGLPEHHKDPADRIIIATALAYGARLASLDGLFRHYVELDDRLISA